MLPEADRIRLRHMADAAAEALDYAVGCTRETLDKNRMLTRAVLHCLLVIGEAAAQVTPEGRALCPEIPWTRIVGMRNRLIHACADVNLDLVWITIQDELPALAAALDAVLSAP